MTGLLFGTRQIDAGRRENRSGGPDLEQEHTGQHGSALFFGSVRGAAQRGAPRSEASAGLSRSARRGEFPGVEFT
jgi:hypothetical protein